MSMTDVDAPAGTSTYVTTLRPARSVGVMTTVRPLPVYVRTPDADTVGAAVR